jgi:hypothetical protein
VDDLSRWRGYGANGFGYCVGFTRFPEAHSGPGVVESRSRHTLASMNPDFLYAGWYLLQACAGGALVFFLIRRVLHRRDAGPSRD